MMNITLRFNTEEVNWEEAAEVLRRAPLGKREPDQIRQSFENSYIACFAYDSDKLIGMGKVISDGVYHAGLYDMAILPEYQGKGIGKMIVEAIHNRLPNTIYGIILFANPGKEPFYEKLGYHRLITGMMRPRNVEWFRKKGHIR